MAISDGLAALVAGNAVLLKPDQQTPLVALAAVELLHSVGLEPDLWPVVHGEGNVVGPAGHRRERLRLLHRVRPPPGARSRRSARSG